MNYNNEINMNLNDIKGYANSALIYIKNDKLDKNEVIMYLSSIEDIINDIKEDLINYLYYLEDKIDKAYEREVNISITNFIASLKEGENNE